VSHIITVNKIIPLKDDYVFVFLEEKDNKIMHPVSNYFLIIDDLSINLLISLKWILWGYFFVSSISKELKNDIYCYNMNEIITDAIQKINDIKGEKNIILIDNKEVTDEKCLNELISTFYSEKYFDEDTKIHIKLKLNLKEYLIISNLFFPTLVKIKKTVVFANKSL
jgi:hypothetical protein